MGNAKITPEDARSFNISLIGLLDRLDIDYAIGGSVAAMSYSEPRFTVDIDIMISADEDKLSSFVSEIEQLEIYVTPLESILEIEIAGEVPINVIDGIHGTKADLYVAQSSGLAASAMQRRQRRGLYRDPAVDAWFLSPEDVILYKLHYYRLSNASSAKHPADIAKMLMVMGMQLDQSYLQIWSERIGVLEFWQTCWNEYSRSRT
jgi:hypothetical protein